MSLVQTEHTRITHPYVHIQIHTIINLQTQNFHAWRPSINTHPRNNINKQHWLFLYSCRHVYMKRLRPFVCLHLRSMTCVWVNSIKGLLKYLFLSLCEFNKVIKQILKNSTVVHCVCVLHIWKSLYMNLLLVTTHQM